MTLIKNSLSLDLAQVFYMASPLYGQASYKISKFLVPILAPFTTNQYTIDNSYSFVKDILKVDNANNFFMASFDIENVFTNIPLHETIEICLNHLFPSPQSTSCNRVRIFF